MHGTNLCKNYPFPCNVHHIHSDHLGSPQCIPGNEVALLNYMGVMVLTRSNSTLFHATSIQEEDIIELCIQLGQTHPKGVLQYLVTESVVLFCCPDEMLVMVHGVIKAIALCEEPIWLHTSPPPPPI